MSWLLMLQGCWPWIPRPEVIEDTESVDTVVVDTEAIDSVDSEIDSEADSEVVAPAWRGILRLEQVQGNGSYWATVSLCVDGRVGTAWTDRFIDTVGDCHVAPSAPSCLDGEGVEVTLRVNRADDDLLPFNDSPGLHTADGPVVAASTALGWRAAAWPGGPEAGTWDDVLAATPLGALVITEGAPAATPDALPMGEADHTVRWTPVADGWVYVRVIAQGAPYEVVRCFVDASLGEVTLGQELFAEWEAGQSVDFSVSLVRVHEGEVHGGVLPIGIDHHMRTGFARIVGEPPER